MDDRELLELAAKAAGIELRFIGNDTPFSDGPKRVGEWNPLINDGDAFRLAVKLGIHFQGHKSYPFCVAQYDLNGHNLWIKQEINNDVPAATRRAIVRAAANIGGQQCRT